MIFERLFNMSCKEIKDFLKKFDFEEVDNDFFKSSNVFKKSENDRPIKIDICFYDSIEINERGIFFIPEHGKCHKLMNFKNIKQLNVFLKLMSIKEINNTSIGFISEEECKRTLRTEIIRYNDNIVLQRLKKDNLWYVIKYNEIIDYGQYKNDLVEKWGLYK
jgi:hypothetical protein